MSLMVACSTVGLPSRACLPTCKTMASSRTSSKSRGSTSRSTTMTSAAASSRAPFRVRRSGSPGPAPTRYTLTWVAPFEARGRALLRGRHSQPKQRDHHSRHLPREEIPFALLHRAVARVRNARSMPSRLRRVLTRHQVVVEGTTPWLVKHRPSRC